MHVEVTQIQQYINGVQTFVLGGDEDYGYVVYFYLNHNISCKTTGTMELDEIMNGFGLSPKEVNEFLTKQ